MSTTSTGYRYIVRTPGVRGGNAIIEGTRFGVHDVIGLLRVRWPRTLCIATT